MNLAVSLNDWYLRQLTDLAASDAFGEILTAKGWSIREAAKVIGCHWSHVARVVRGERHSARLIGKILALPKKP